MGQRNNTLDALCIREGMQYMYAGCRDRERNSDGETGAERERERAS